MSEWRISGDVLIACNCDYGCPCNFNALPSRGFCEGGWIWKIADGHVAGVGLGGLGVAVFAKWPGAIHEGGGRAASFIDSRADAPQRDALTRLVRGEVGGPWGIFSKTYNLSAPVSVPFDIDVSRHASRARLGDVVELELRTIRNAVTQAEVHPEIVLPEGLVLKHAGAAASAVFRVGSELAYDHSGQYAAFGRFEYP